MPSANNAAVARMLALGRSLSGAESAMRLRAAPEEWIVTMIERMLLHCEQQFDALTAQMPETPSAHATSARALASLERTMSHLAQGHAQLRLNREQKVLMSDDQLRAKINAALDRALIGFRAAGLVELAEPQRSAGDKR